LTMRILVRNADGSWLEANKAFSLARPPLLIVHGINNDVVDLKDTYALVTDSVDMPIVGVSHAQLPNGRNGLRGRGILEEGAGRLADAIDLVKTVIRRGNSIPANASFPGNRPWGDYHGYTGKKLSIQRVDLMGHSYGG